MRGLWPARKGFVLKSGVKPKVAIWTLETAWQKTVANGKTVIETAKSTNSGIKNTQAPRVCTSKNPAQNESLV